MSLKDELLTLGQLLFIAFLFWLMIRHVRSRNSSSRQPAKGTAPGPIVDTPSQGSGLSFLRELLLQERSYRSRVEAEPAPAIPSAPLCRLPNGSFYDLCLSGGHWGIFGASGSGKGNTLQLLALRLLQFGPEWVQLIILDPKAGLDYTWADTVAHARLYAADLVTAGYQWALAEMSRRNLLLREAGCRNIREYSLRYPEEPLPYLLILADEVADLSKDDKARLASLARMGRAAGLVLFVCTQYPTAEALSTQVQANLINRLVLRLASKRHTEVALSRYPGEKGDLEPAEFDRPGMAVLKTEGGREQRVDVPELTEPMRDAYVTDLRYRYPRAVSQKVPQAAQEGSGSPEALEGYDEIIQAYPGLVELVKRIIEGITEETSKEEQPQCSRCGLGPEAGEMRLTPRGGKLIHKACYGKKENG